jgi:hypothetical protein
MPLWPFKKRRSAATNKDTPVPPSADRSDNNNTNFNHDPTRPSTGIAQRSRRGSQHTERIVDAEISEQQPSRRHATTTTPGEKNIDHQRSSVEDITALPVSWNLERSPPCDPLMLNARTSLTTSETTQLRRLACHGRTHGQLPGLEPYTLNAVLTTACPYAVTPAKNVRTTTVSARRKFAA